MASAELVIAPLETAEQYRTCERLQQIVWEAEPIEVVPAHLLVTAQRHGGLVLGAFVGGRMVGFLFGFSGTVAPDNRATVGARWEHCSHLLGVLPEWRGQGLGYRLKLAQRDWAIRQGLELVTWTYDPLQAANAVLNLGKLGAVCRCYLRDFYGELADEVNAGLPSDRFEVAWWVGSARVRERVEQGWKPPSLADLLAEGAFVLNPGRPTPEGWGDPGPVGQPAGPQALVEFPAHIRDLKSHSLPLAEQWQLSVRQACELAFAEGYTAVDVVRADVDGIARRYYLFTREGCADMPSPQGGRRAD